MDIQTLTTFFMWCTIINGTMLGLSIAMFISAPDLVYRIQNRFLPIPRETYDAVIYAFLGLFKIFILIFNAVPFVALLIVG